MFKRYPLLKKATMVALSLLVVINFFISVRLITSIQQRPRVGYVDWATVNVALRYDAINKVQVAIQPKVMEIERMKERYDKMEEGLERNDKKGKASTHSKKKRALKKWKEAENALKKEYRESVQAEHNSRIQEVLVAIEKIRTEDKYDIIVMIPNSSFYLKVSEEDQFNISKRILDKIGLKEASVEGPHHSSSQK